MSLDNDMRHKFWHGCRASEFLLLARFHKQPLLCCHYPLFLLWKEIDHFSLWEQTLGGRGHCSVINFPFNSRMERARGLPQRELLQWCEAGERQHTQFTETVGVSTLQQLKWKHTHVCTIRQYIYHMHAEHTLNLPSTSQLLGWQQQKELLQDWHTCVPLVWCSSTHSYLHFVMTSSQGRKGSGT